MSMLQKWKRIAIIVVSSGMSQILSLAFGLLLVRVLSVSDYAVYRQGMLIVNTVSPLFSILSPISLSYFFARAQTDEERKSYVLQTVMALGLISLAGAVVLVLAREPVSSLYNDPGLAPYLPAFAVILFVEASTQFFAYYMVCEGKERMLMVITIIFSFLRMLALVVSILTGRHILTIFLTLYVLIEIFRCLFIFIYTVRKNLFRGFRLRADYLKAQFRFSLPVYMMSIINTVNTGLDKNIVAMLYRPELYAVYENGAYQIPFVNVISSGIISVMLPDIAQRFRADDQPALDGIIQEYKGMIRVSMGVFLALFVSLFTFSNGVVLFLFSEKYMDSAPIFRVYLLMLLFQALNLGVLLTSADRQKDIVKAGIAMIIANFVMLLGVHQFLSFNDLVWAPVASTLLMNLLLLGSIRRVYRQRSMWAVIPVGYLLRVVVPVGAVIPLFWWIQRIVPLEGVLETVILGPVCFLTALGIAFLVMRSGNSLRKDG